MQITFLGASHGVPEANRRCSCTLIETNGRYYFIDMGVNAIDALRTRGIEVEDVKGIFITHMHGDHTNGLILSAGILKPPTLKFACRTWRALRPSVHGSKRITAKCATCALKRSRTARSSTTDI